MTTRCGRARRELWPDSGPRSATAGVVDARRHVAECAQCTAFFAEMRAMAEHLHATAPRPIAPLEVRDRLFERIAGARTNTAIRSRSRSPWIAGWALAALLLLVIGVRAFEGRVARPREPLLAALAREHAHTLGEFGISSSDPAEVARWLKGRLPFAVQVPVFSDAPLRGARLIDMNGTRAVVIQYDIGEEALSYFVVGRDDVHKPGDSGLHESALDGYHVESWVEPGLLHALIANAPQSVLRQLADECMKQAAMTIAFLPMAESRGGAAF